MLKEHESVLKKLLIVFDLLLIAAAFFLGHYLRRALSDILGHDQIQQIYSLKYYLDILPFFVGAWGISMLFSGAYHEIRTQGIRRIISNLIKSAFFATLLFGSYAYLLQLTYISRTLIAVTSLVTFGLLIAERLFILITVRMMAKKGRNIRNILIVGTGPRAKTFMDLVDKNTQWGFRIVGLLDTDESLVNTIICGHKVLGTLEDVPKLMDLIVVDEIVFVVPRNWLGNIENTILYCEMLGKRVSVAMDLFNLKFAKPKPRDFYNYPLLTFETTTDKLTELFIKRCLDVIVAIIGIIITSPIMLLSVILIRTHDKGPILFKQLRCGLNGRHFTVYKFRTMVMGAEKKLKELQKENEMSGPAFKMTNDPRITKHGNWMRKFSVDELPQFFNVLQGHMSIVGPRPPIPAEVRKYEPWQLRRLSMRPGLTCIWQVQGRNKIVKFEEWMKMDLDYIDQWSLFFDLKLFLKTIPVVVFGIGAK